MKNINLLLIFLISANYIAHLLVDYIFQTNNTVEHKKSNRIMVTNHIIPGFIVNFLGILALTKVLHWKQPVHNIGIITFIGCFAIWIIHYILDIIKVRLIQPKFNKFIHLDWISYVSDQIIHFIVILIVSFFEYKFIEKNNILLEISFNKNIIAALTMLCIIILITRFTQFLIKKILNSHFNNINSTLCLSFRSETLVEKKENALASGTSIGIMERLLILLAILNVSLFTPIITSIIALKSVTRFEKINSDSKYAEYYLLGSLISILSALFFSIIGKNIVNIILK